MPAPGLSASLQYWLAVLVLPAIAAELVFPFVPGSTSAKLTLLLVAATVLAGARFSLGAPWAAHALAFAVYMMMALLRHDFVVSSFFVADLQVGMQGLVVLAIVMPFLDEESVRRRFFHDVGVGLAVLGLLAASAGVAKLALQTRGVLLPSLEWEGLYPRGTSLRIDYNVYALGLIVCLAAAIGIRMSPLALAWERGIATLAVPIIFLTVAFTSSRRGALFLVLILPLMSMSLPTVAHRIRMLRVPLLSLAGAGALLGALYVRSDSAVLLRVSEYVDLAQAAERVLAVNDPGQLFQTRAPLVADAWSQVSLDAGAFDLIFGRGDGYLREMGRVFNREVDYEYPHNLVLSTSLHGGVLLASAVLLAMGIAIVSAWRWRATDLWVLCALLFSIAFSLSSASSLYGFDLLVTLVMLCTGSSRGRSYVRGPALAGGAA